jgi:pyruvate/2-oxoacid:ferredoxin oxidoreductase beta subunit
MSESVLTALAEINCPAADPLLRPGNGNCGGCGMSTALQFLGRAMDDRRLQIVIPASCGAITVGPFPYSAMGVPVILSTFGSAASVATGMSQVARLNGEGTRVVCWAGDGGTYDIGMASLSGAAERNEDILYVCYDNEIYGNTGGQRSSATPAGAATTNTPRGKVEQKKDILGIMSAHRIPYAATLSLAHPQDAIRKMRRALDLHGFRFLHVLAPCPTGWKSEPALGIRALPGGGGGGRAQAHHQRRARLLRGGARALPVAPAPVPEVGHHHRRPAPGHRAPLAGPAPAQRTDRPGGARTLKQSRRT